MKLDSNLRDDLDLTSLDAMNVIMALEDEFGQEADIEQILELQTVQQLVDYLLSLLQQPK
ncbi:MAG: phosphopantetheine-binding protein [SAR324 cluster bacterium]|nr:phosphopantetheine-binding protein [SAR324 cluster bacterium]